MITQYLKAPPFEYITMIVGAQLGGLLLLSVFIVGLMLHRNWRRRRLDAYAQEFSTAMIDEMMGAPAHLELPPRRHPLRRLALRQTLLTHLKQVSGPEKTLLARRYETLGFARGDLRRSRSWFWWHRLQAVANLALLESDAYASTFARLTADRHDLVVAYAYIPLSRLLHPLNAHRPLAELPAAVLSRENVTHEILRNWARIHGHRFLIDEIASTWRPDLLLRLVRALASESTPDVADAFTRKLSKPGLSPAAIAEMLVLLRKVGDPASIPTVRQYLDHAHETVRLRALEFLAELGEVDAIRASRIGTDDSVAIRRALRSLGFREAA